VLVRPWQPAEGKSELFDFASPHAASVANLYSHWFSLLFGVSTVVGRAIWLPGPNARRFIWHGGGLLIDALIQVKELRLHPVASDHHPIVQNFGEVSAPATEVKTWWVPLSHILFCRVTDLDWRLGRVYFLAF
jgi:hypothetical protein